MEAFEKLSTLLSEMQLEMTRRTWTEDHLERGEIASDFRRKLFDAICAYRDYWIELSSSWKRAG